MTGGGKGPVEAATFAHPWDADLARNYLEDAGVEAWVEDPYRISGGSGLVRLLVPADRVIDARLLLAELKPDLDDEPEGAAGGGYPLWVTFAAVVLLGGVISAAVPRFLWVPTAAIGLIGYWLFRRYRRIGDTLVPSRRITAPPHRARRPPEPLWDTQGSPVPAPIAEHGHRLGSPPFRQRVIEESSCKRSPAGRTATAGSSSARGSSLWLRRSSSATPSARPSRTTSISPTRSRRGR